MHRMEKSGPRGLARLAGRIAAAVICWAGASGTWEAKAQDADQKMTNEVCLGCHGAEGFEMPRTDGTVRSLFIPKDGFEKSVHGRLLYQCVDCHTKITEIPHENIAKTLIEWRQSIPDVCGKCHEKQRNQYLNSVHGKELMKGNAKAAVCFDCHTAHEIDFPALGTSKLAITKNCGNCHQAQLKSYVETYHGQVNTLGYAYTAKCFDCHGNHTIQRVSDPAAAVYPANRLQTCQKCHEDATPGFVTFQPHATTSDFARYPQTWVASKFMILLLAGTLSFFWAHSALWWYREFRERQEHKMTPHVLADEVLKGGQVQYYRRWPAIWRIAHLVFALTVMTLVFTGMTLFYADSFWAPVVQNAFGGPRVTGTVHRVFAVVFVAIFFAHLAYVASRVLGNWRTFNWFGPYSFVPNLQDLWDAFAMFKWFFGRGPRPIFDRWTYWEKFDYWAPFWGVTIIGVSGAMLWFKSLTASVLPGWVFNVATIFHGEEAFLAAGFLFTVHFFNNHWRPDNFPLDIMMFTGVMPLDKFRREHTVEYDRLVRSGELKDFLVDAPSQPMTVGSKILGFALMAAGLALFILIMIGFTHSLLGRL